MKRFFKHYLPLLWICMIPALLLCGCKGNSIAEPEPTAEPVVTATPTPATPAPTPAPTPEPEETPAISIPVAGDPGTASGTDIVIRFAAPASSTDLQPIPNQEDAEQIGK